MKRTKKIKIVKVDSNWRHMNLGLIIYNDDNLLENDLIIGTMENEKWLGVAKRFRSPDNIDYWYLKVKMELF